MKGVVIFVLTMLVIAEFMVQPNEAINCHDVGGLLEPCLGFLTGGGIPSLECCRGLNTLKDKTPSTVDKQVACTCAQLAAVKYKVVDVFAKALPGLCGVTIDVPISTTFNCSTIK
ncbi:non-specific lipid-transfer protein 1-like [Bidens hawaiensis]|uniref:non-specific lipid-transfer protein 1-like n=1 Tax=Bidens hawaiensis TaxID=980011 RepID=UPI00404A15DE